MPETLCTPYSFQTSYDTKGRVIAGWKPVQESRASILFSSSFSPLSIISESYRMQRVPILWYNNQFKSYTCLLTWSKLMLTTTRPQCEVSSERSCISTVSLCPWIVLSSQWIVVLHLMSKQRYIYFFWFSLSLPKCDQHCKALCFLIV